MKRFGILLLFAASLMGAEPEANCLVNSKGEQVSENCINYRFQVRKAWIQNHVVYMKLNIEDHIFFVDSIGFGSHKAFRPGTLLHGAFETLSNGDTMVMLPDGKGHTAYYRVLKVELK